MARIQGAPSTSFARAVPHTRIYLPSAAQVRASFPADKAKLRSPSVRACFRRARLAAVRAEAPASEQIGFAPHPSETAPAMLVSNVPGTWAYDTMSRRIRENILSKVFEDNELAPEQRRALEALDEELQRAATVLLRDVQADGGEDVDTWRRIMAPHVGTDTWLDTPWLTAEFYFYRRIMEAVRWFELRQDPFQKQKDLGLVSSESAIKDLARQLSKQSAGLLEGAADAAVKDVLDLFVLTSLWGNRMDLSLWPEDGSSSERAGGAMASALAAGEQYLLHDDLPRVTQELLAARAAGGQRVDIVVDNAGFELVCDLCLADALVLTGAASEVKLHLKGHPTFVSDAMEKDVLASAEFIKQMGGQEGAVGQRWLDHIAEGKWVLQEGFYWAQPNPLWDMPEEVADDVAGAAVVFLKGDANYRRLLGDSPWPLTKPFDEVAGYFPAKLCALRTLKAELGCGMPKEGIERAQAEDPTWLTDGQWGVVQFTTKGAVTGE